jgi:protocatechuate 3,4-dioxygenase alpha subunit
MQLRESPSQTAGPYIHIGSNPNWVEITGVWDADLGLVMVTPETRGERILIEGTVFDGAGVPLTDALVEIWQADADGRYNADPSFPGWGRQPTDPATGKFRFETIRPGPVPFDAKPFDAKQTMAPHISLWLVARGINIGLHTRLYFEDHAERNARDPVLARIADPRRRQTLLARRESLDGPPSYRFDIHLQGPDETVFFDI